MWAGTSRSVSASMSRLAGEEADQLLLGDEPEAHQDGAQLVGLALLLGEGLAQLPVGDQALDDEKIAEAAEHLLAELHLRHRELLL